MTLFDWKKPTEQLLGHWHPWRDEHFELFKKAFKKTKQVAIMVRDVQDLDDKPFDFLAVRGNINAYMLERGYIEGKHYIVLLVPNIVDVVEENLIDQGKL